jgi:hypothetical protein
MMPKAKTMAELLVLQLYRLTGLPAYRYRWASHLFRAVRVPPRISAGALSSSSRLAASLAFCASIRAAFRAEVLARLRSRFGARPNGPGRPRFPVRLGSFLPGLFWSAISITHSLRSSVADSHRTTERRDSHLSVILKRPARASERPVETR